LFDDILSSLDPEMANKIFNDVILGELKNKTIIFITHNIQYCCKADYIYAIDEGKIKKQGDYQNLISLKNETIDKPMSSDLDDDNFQGNFILLTTFKKNPNSRIMKELNINNESDGKKKPIHNFYENNNPIIKKNENQPQHSEYSLLTHQNQNSSFQEQYKIFQDEESKVGMIRFSVIWYYLTYIGGIFGFLALFIIFLLNQILTLGKFQFIFYFKFFFY
jgi:ABC-type multidrug transport system ATPase subunit